MPMKTNRWGGKQSFDPNTGKFASKSGAPGKKKFKAFAKPQAKKGFANYKRKTFSSFKRPAK